MSGIRDLAERRSLLSPEQRAKLAQRLRGGGAVAASRHAIPRRSQGERIPLSFAQQRLWFLWKLDPDSAAYHLSGGLHLTGPLDIAALRSSLGALVLRHASLRTIFQESDSGVEQVVLPPLEVALPCVDLSDGDAESREQKAREEIERLRDEPFDLASGPLLRAVLLHLQDAEHRLILVMHHIVLDAQSTHIILCELAELYRATLTGQAPQLPELPLEYADYAAWQREWLTGAEGQRQLDWWTTRLGSDAPVMTLATDRPRKANGQYAGAAHTVRLDADLVARLRLTVQSCGGTLFMALLTAFQAQLFRYTGIANIRVGVPIANRNRAEMAGVVGFFINTQVLSAELDEKISLADLLRQTRDAAIDAQAYQDLPFERLVEALQPERSLAHNPIFQVVFNHLRRDDRSLQTWPGISAQRLDFDAPNAQFELTLETCEDAAGHVEATFRYAADLFDAKNIERMAGHYVALLQALADDPRQPVGDVGLLSDAERQQLHTWGVNATSCPNAQPVHRLIERQAALRPQATAVIFEDTALTYAQLNARANRLAHHLIGCGVRPETKVGIAVARSLDMVVGLVAILKAGGAYVPLDPEYPADRLAYMIEDSGIGLLLTQNAVRDRVPIRSSVKVLELDHLALRDQPEHDPSVAVHGENLAYVIYTSGSTGKPKGAANRHDALHNRLAWMQDAYRLDDSDTVLQKTPFGFDVSVWEFFWPLLAGARLAMAAPGEHREPARLVERIRRHRVTTLHFVPSMLQAFLTHAQVASCTCLRRLICSGEALPADVQNAVLERLPQVSLFNLYGPTEAAIDVTHWTCRNDGAHQVPIGRPISDTAVYVLDDHLNLAPAGAAGELYLGGAGLARGYLGRPALSAERFVADPFDTSGGRLYRTGDRVRWNAQGHLDYLGRIDHQVKIRGFRIEPGEVEAQLLAQPGVREAVVTAAIDAGGARLVGYVSAIAGHDIDVAALRERLARSLPDYMVPGAIVVLERLPLTANGKVDRKALPAPEVCDRQACEAPQGEVEQSLAAIWAEVLGVERVGRQDNFFALGGHSLLAVQVAARLASHYACDMPVRTFFEAPTLAAFASRLSAAWMPAGDVRQDRLARMNDLMSEFEV